MQHAVKSSPMAVVEECFWGKKLLSVCGGYRPGESLWVHSNGVNRKPTFHANKPTCHDFPRFVIISEKLRPEVGNRYFDQAKWRFFWQKRPLRANFHKCFPKSDMETRLFVQILWNLADRKSVKSRVVSWTTKKQTFGSRSRCRFYADRAQNLSRTAPNNVLGVPQISSKSKRVNIVQTRHKVFAILGEASASSPSNRIQVTQKDARLLLNLWFSGGLKFPKVR